MKISRVLVFRPLNCLGLCTVKINFPFLYCISRLLHFSLQLCDYGRFGNMLSFSIKLQEQLLSDFSQTRLPLLYFPLNWFWVLQGEVGVIETKRNALVVWMLALKVAPFQKKGYTCMHTNTHEPRLWSCYLRSRDAVGKLRRWTALTGTGAVTSGSPRAAPDLSTQTPCRDADRHRHFDSCST